MNVEQLDANERQAFLTWRRKLARFGYVLLHSSVSRRIVAVGRVGDWLLIFKCSNIYWASTKSDRFLNGLVQCFSMVKWWNKLRRVYTWYNAYKLATMFTPVLSKYCHILQAFGYHLWHFNWFTLSFCLLLWYNWFWGYKLMHLSQTSTW